MQPNLEKFKFKFLIRFLTQELLEVQEDGLQEVEGPMDEDVFHKVVSFQKIHVNFP